MLNKIINILLSLLFLITSILISVLFVLNFIPIYRLGIKLFDLTTKTGLSSYQLIADYTKIIKFLQLPWIDTLYLENFPMSYKGIFHFFEVKNIFFKVYIVLILCLFLLIIFYYFNKKTSFVFPIKSYNYFFYTTLSLFLILVIGFFANFQILFNKFHDLFFSNDYWIFDSKLDPVILALPEDFFMLCSLLVISLVLFISILSKLYYSRLNSHT